MTLALLPVAAVTVDLATTSIVWVGGEAVGASGGFWRTYWTGLGLAAAAALGTYVITDSMDAASAVLILGLPVGNVYGYATSREEDRRETDPDRLSARIVELRF